MARPVTSLEEANQAWQSIKATLDYEIQHLNRLRDKGSSAERLLYQQNMIADLMEQERQALSAYLAIRPLQA